MKRAARWLRRLLIACLALLVIGLLIVVVVMPMVARHQAQKALERIDPHAEFKLRDVSLRRLELEEISLGSPPWLTADAVEVSYGLLGLLRGRLDTVSILGAQWHVLERASKLDPGIRFKRRIGEDVALDLPFRELVISSGAVIVEAGNARLHLPVDGVLVRDSENRCSLSVSAQEGTLTMGRAEGGKPWVEGIGADIVLDVQTGPQGLTVSSTGGTLQIETLGSGVPVAAGPFRLAIAAADDRPLLTVSDQATVFLAGAGLRAVEPVSFQVASLEGTIASFEMGVTARRSASEEMVVDLTAMISVRAVGVGDVRLEARGRLGASGGAPAGELHVEVPRTMIEDPAGLARLLGMPADATAGGSLSLTADLSFGGQAPARMVKLELADGSLTMPQQDLEVQDISGSLTLGRLSPLASAGGQVLTIGSGRVGKVPVRDGIIVFTLESPRSLLMEQARWTMGDSARLTATAFRIDPSDPVFETTVYGEDLSLSYWLPLLTDGRAGGGGSLYGRLPITFRPRSTPRMALGQGFLYAAPGGGWIVVDDVQQLGGLLEQSDSRFKTDETMQEVKQRLIDALSDFEFDTLRLELVPEPEGTLLRVFTSGKGRRGKDPQEIGGMTINIHNIGVALSNLFSYRSAVERATDR